MWRLTSKLFNMKKIFLLYFCFSGLYAAAQDERQVIIVDRSQARKKTANDNMPRRLVDLNQVFKFDPFRMAIGEINFAYERVIDQQSSVEIELGPTVSNLGKNRFGVTNNGTSQYKTNSEMGVFASAAYRFYPLDGRPALNQLYISPKFKYRLYNESMEGINGSSLASVKGNTQESIFTFNFGYQQWLAERFSFDYYVGIGIGSYNRKSYYGTSEYVGTEWKEVWMPRNDRYTHFVGTIGLKVGIGN